MNARFLVAVFALFVFSVSFVVSPANAITLGQWDNFEASQDLENWTCELPNPNPPVWNYNGGPLGPGDAFIEVEGNGELSAGGKPTIFNEVQWSGDYISAGVNTISIATKYLGLGPEEMNLRIAFTGSGETGTVWTREVVTISPGTPEAWETVVFRIDPAYLDGTDPATVMSDVQRMWLYHCPDGSTPYDAPPVDVRVGYDNIRALHTVPEPGSLTLLCLAAMAIPLYGRRR